MRRQRRARISQCFFGSHEEVFLRSNTAKLRAFDQTVENCSDLVAALGLRAVMISSSDNWASEATLDLIRIQWQARIIEKHGKALPATEHILYSSTK